MNLSITKVRDQMAKTVKRVARNGDRVVLERRGKGVAALVSMEDLAFLEKMEDQADIRAAMKARKEKGRVSLEELKKRLGMD